nr:RNA-directed DNA polymerase, eukaryota [Tanacetum cinerariifolium]
METLNSLLASVSLSNSCDRWFCDLADDAEFQVKEVRNFIDDLTLPSQSEPTRWVRFIPIKVNIFDWCARLDCLPTRVNLTHRGVHVDSSSCSLCDSNEEDVHHLFFGCDFSRLILRRICTWWDLGVHDWSSFQECFEIALFLKRVLPNARRFLMILFFVLLTGVLVVLVENFPFLG